MDKLPRRAAGALVSLDQYRKPSSGFALSRFHVDLYHEENELRKQQIGPWHKQKARTTFQLNHHLAHRLQMVWDNGIGLPGVQGEFHGDSGGPFFFSDGCTHGLEYLYRHGYVQIARASDVRSRVQYEPTEKGRRWLNQFYAQDFFPVLLAGRRQQHRAYMGDLYGTDYWIKKMRGENQG